MVIFEFALMEEVELGKWEGWEGHPGVQRGGRRTEAT